MLKFVFFFFLFLADITTPVPTSCSETNCYFGAICEESDGRAKCICTMTCSDDDSTNLDVSISEIFFIHFESSKYILEEIRAH